jgi:diaminopimelate dehydrogenase
MIRAAIVGYGNIGKSVFEAISCASDFELAGVVVRRDLSNNMPAELQGVKVTNSPAELGKIDVAIICTESRGVEAMAKPYLEKGINTVDSFDIHSKIWDLKVSLDATAKANGAVAVISAGWDPGSDSVVRALLEAMAPRGLTYTNFGPGMSMGHTVAVKAIAGVKKALSMTIPTGTGIHRRMVYIELEDGFDADAVAANIKNDPYFIHDETIVTVVSDVDSLIDMGHGVNLTRKGVSGTTYNQNFEFNMKINNPALTAQILVASARASVKQRPGCYTLIEIPPVDMLQGDKEDLIKRLV